MSTTDDLKEAFAGESQANRKYLAYGEQAVTDGFPGVAKLFRAVAAAETIHALAHLRAMGGVKSTLDNLTEAQGGEQHEFTEMYPPMLERATAAGDKRAMRSMRYALEVEKVHFDLFAQALAALKTGTDLGAETARVCPHCGHTVIGDAPDSCPVCGCKGENYLDVA
ncbi:rubrerythrin family protein [Siculibacillus lacustris]|uniref:Rubrerythrin family protein n=1 Tax=Siculibacillus lacustris TaxID=1549641 RepID=A0A4Q9VL91_9HYPH|nr:rubrerythrin family protein [Siculibacillus lacustris]TBW36248.1 rubrerythrin family protein [Siculibacillus lacustris]